MTEIRKQIAGQSSQALQTQQAHELKRNPLSARRNICHKAGITSKTHLSGEYALSMMETLKLTWSQERTLRRFLKQSGVKIPSEHILRNVMKGITSNDVQIQSKPFIDSRGKLTETPMVSIKDLPRFISKMLDKYDKHNYLTWHDETIPNNEIWVKVGADHGKGSFKFSLSVVNTANPNSKFNTVLAAMAKTTDCRDNLDRFFEDIKIQLRNLDLMSWRDKKIRLFLFGDYEFLCKVHGISGACGSYPCLWCLASKKDIQNPQKADAPARTWTNLYRDYQRFMSYGKGLKKNAQCFNNCIHPPLFDISLQRVTPPYLHCLLGITLKHHKLLEAAADEIDKLLFADRNNDNDTIQDFQNFGKNWLKYVDLNNTLHHYNECLILSFTEEEKGEWKTKIEVIEEHLSSLEKEDLTERCGPVCSKLDNILQTNNITPQFYHSRSFIGNHCHRYFTNKVYEQLTDLIVKETYSNTHNLFIRDSAEEIKEMFDNINRAFAEVHSLLSHSKPIPHDHIQPLQIAIDQYMTIYRTHFPDKIIPKQHILEKHCVPFISTFRFGLGILGEQGGELIHSTVSKFEKRAQAVKNDSSYLTIVMNSSLLQVSPDIQSQVPKKRVKTKKHV